MQGSGNQGSSRQDQGTADYSIGNDYNIGDVA